MTAEKIYEIDPRTILFPAGKHAFLQRLGQEDSTTIDDPSTALAFIACFTPVAALDSARTRFTAIGNSFAPDTPQAGRYTAATFEKLAGVALKLGILREPSTASTERAFDGQDERALLTAINMVAEDLVSEIGAMGPAAPRYVREETGATLDTILRQALGELTRVMVALGTRRGSYVDEQLGRLAVAGKQPRLHLGANGNNLAGWYNIDLAPAELALNLTWGLPFEANSIEFVFLAHLFEHLYKGRDAPRLLKEIHRVLKPGCVVRIIVPDAEAYMRAYVEGDDKFFAMQRRVWSDWAPKTRTHLEAILGYLGAPELPGGSGQHKYAYDFATLKLLLEEAGFGNIVRSTFMGSAHDVLRMDDASLVAGANADGRYASLFVEAQK